MLKNEQLTHTILTLLNDFKALDIDTLPISTISDFADTMIICTGTSTTHCSSIQNRLIEELKDQGIAPHNQHNAADKQWILLDYCDVVVNIMLQSTRDFYQLEKLWTDIDEPMAAEA